MAQLDNPGGPARARDPRRLNWRPLVAALLLLAGVGGAVVATRSGSGGLLGSTGAPGATPTRRPVSPTPSPVCGRGSAWNLVDAALPAGDPFAGSRPGREPDAPGSEADAAGSHLAQVAVTGTNDAWAVGATRTGDTSSALIEHWDGQTWHAAGGDLALRAGALNAVTARGPGDVWAVGLYTDAAGKVVPLAEHWDGTRWTATTNPESDSNYRALSGVSILPGGAAWAVGYAIGSRGQHTPILQHWDGTAWHADPGPASAGPGGDELAAVQALSAGDVWAVGHATGAAPSSSRTQALHWDGTAWRVVPTVDPATGLNYLVSVAAAAPSDVWAAGYSSNPGAAYTTLIEHWDGQRWSLVPSPNVGSNLNKLNAISVISSGEVWAAGYYLDAGHLARALTEHWDGRRWSVVPGANTTGHTVLNGIAARTAQDVWAAGYSTDRTTGTRPLLARYYDPCAPVAP